MMDKVRNIILKLTAAIASLFVSSACILFVPIVYNHHTATLLCSMSFWMFLIIGYVLIFLIKRKSKKCGFKADKKKIGLFTFFRNTTAKVVFVK